MTISWLAERNATRKRKYPHEREMAFRIARTEGDYRDDEGNLNSYSPAAPASQWKRRWKAVNQRRPNEFKSIGNSDESECTDRGAPHSDRGEPCGES